MSAADEPIDAPDGLHPGSAEPATGSAPDNAEQSAEQSAVPETTVWAVVDDFASRLEKCLEGINPQTGRRWTLDQVAAGMKKLGGPVAPSYISNLKNGKIDNPGFKTVVALTILFQVESDYFMTADPQRLQDLESQMLAWRAIQDADLYDLLLRLETYTPSARMALVAFLNGLDAMPGMRKEQPKSRLRRLATRTRKRSQPPDDES